MGYKHPIEVLEDERHRIIGRFYELNLIEDEDGKAHLRKKTMVAPLKKHLNKITRAIDILQSFSDEIEQ